MLASLNVNLFIQSGRQGRSQDYFLPRLRKFQPEAAERFSHILYVHSGVSSRSVWVEHFSYMTRHMPKIAARPNPTEVAEGVPLDVGTEANWGEVSMGRNVRGAKSPDTVGWEAQRNC